MGGSVVKGSYKQWGGVSVVRGSYKQWGGGGSVPSQETSLTLKRCSSFLSCSRMLTARHNPAG